MEQPSPLGIAARGHLLDGEFLPILRQARTVLVEEPTVVHISSPVTVCGNINGHFHDLLMLFRTAGDLPDTRYLFLGGYVNKGLMSVETLALLLAYKVKFPDRITLLRGNYESGHVSQIHGYYEECQVKFGGDPAPWRASIEVFDSLPLAAVINNQIFCVHGGLSPELRTLDQISVVDRSKDVPLEGPLCDLLWSDPVESLETWSVPGSGCGFEFGDRVVRDFLRLNGLNLICRAHRFCENGYKYFFDNRLVSVWSVPNYRWRLGNPAAVISFDEDLVASPKTFLQDPDSHSRRMERSKRPLYFL